jgi:hypothetical protein
MYAIIRRYTNVRGTLSDLVPKVREVFLPQIRKLPGFIEYHALDAGDGVIASISVFDTRESAEKSVRLAADFVKQHLANFLPNAPEVTQGEAVISEMGEPELEREVAAQPAGRRAAADVQSRPSPEARP